MTLKYRDGRVDRRRTTRWEHPNAKPSIADYDNELARDLADALDASLAREKALREALRDEAIKSALQRTHRCCNQCHAIWPADEPERHAPGCLCAIPEGA